MVRAPLVSVHPMTRGRPVVGWEGVNSSRPAPALSGPGVRPAHATECPAYNGAAASASKCSISACGALIWASWPVAISSTCQPG